MRTAGKVPALSSAVIRDGRLALPQSRERLERPSAVLVRGLGNLS